MIPLPSSPDLPSSFDPAVFLHSETEDATSHLVIPPSLANSVVIDHKASQELRPFLNLVTRMSAFGDKNWRRRGGGVCNGRRKKWHIQSRFDI